MPRGRPMPELLLTADEHETLERWTRRPTTAQALAQRARMILAYAEGRPNDHVARRERVTRQTVGRWRARFVSKRLDGLLDEPRRKAVIGAGRNGYIRLAEQLTKPRRCFHVRTPTICFARDCAAIFSSAAKSVVVPCRV